jgi:cell wall-associated NlpC family hydrolase
VKNVLLNIALILLALFLSAGCGFYQNGWIRSESERAGIVRTAERYIGAQYRHGGATPQGFDCSGYVMYVYQQNGILLPRQVNRQYEAGKHIRLRQTKPGDLVFFRTSRSGRLSHVGIYVGGNRFIHAPRSGKRVSYADMGKPYWKKRYRGSVTFMSKIIGRK